MYNKTNQSSKRIPLALFLSIVGIYLILSPAHFLTTPDERINLRTTLSFLEGKWGAIPVLDGSATKTGIDGNEYAQYGLGVPLAAVPWTALGRAIDPSENRHANRLDSIQGLAKEGTIFLQGWVTVFTMILTALTVVLFHSILIWIGIPISTAVFSAFLLAFCTFCWPHGRNFFTEPLTAFCLMAAVHAFLQSRTADKPGIWIFLAGCFWAYAALTRLDTLVTGLAAAWFLCAEYRDERLNFRIPIKPIILFSIPWFFIFFIILSYNFMRFGSFVSTGYEDQPEKIRFLTPLLVGLHGFLFTPGRSLFLYSPPLIFAGFGIWKLWKKEPWLTGGLLLLIGGYLVAMSKWQNWAGGYDWGPRHVYQITPFLMIFTAAYMGQHALFNTPAKRIGWAVLIIISLFIQYLGLSADPVTTIERLQYQWRNAPIASPYLMQFTIYVPQFSGLALHWDWITTYGPDLFVRRVAAESPKFLIVYFVPLIISVWGSMTLWRACLEKNETVPSDNQ